MVFPVSHKMGEIAIPKISSRYHPKAKIRVIKITQFLTWHNFPTPHLQVIASVIEKKVGLTLGGGLPVGNVTWSYEDAITSLNCYWTEKGETWTHQVDWNWTDWMEDAENFRSCQASYHPHSPRCCG